ncbi:uncharacterized protein [Leptinotarsa decemlineata]|uniref:uncharacterized protein n=1 Tax=Leptinotarsa decemlineata TaxID=7539 RepID=UPI003D30BD5B
MELEDIAILACYISPNIPLEQYKREVDDIMDAVTEVDKKMVIAGDINAASPLWGSPRANVKGEHWADWIASKNLSVQNKGDMPTFVRRGSATFIDVTLTTRGITNKVKNWEVQTEESLSHHRIITFVIIQNKIMSTSHLRGKAEIDHETFQQVLSIFENKITNHTEMTQAIKRAQSAATFNVRPQRRDQPYWWNEDIGKARSRCNAARRALSRSRRISQVAEARVLDMEREHRERRKEYKKLMNESKRSEWNKLCEEIDQDIFGQGYKIVTRAIRHINTPYNLTQTEKEKIVRELFPEHEDTVFPSYPDYRI